jgi:hypothetical protein
VQKLLPLLTDGDFGAGDGQLPLDCLKFAVAHVPAAGQPTTFAVVVAGPVVWPSVWPPVAVDRRYAVRDIAQAVGSLLPPLQLLVAADVVVVAARLQPPFAVAQLVADEAIELQQNG